MFNRLVNLFRYSRQERRLIALVTKSIVNRSVDDYRQKFATAPVGRWSQAVGTFSCVHDEDWEFYPDHTGKFTEYGPFGGERGETLFEWKEAGNLTILCRVTKWPVVSDEDDSEEEEEAGDEDESNTWETIRYNFVSIQSDVGELIAMCEVSPDGTVREGFWHSMEPLSYSGDW